MKRAMKLSQLLAGTAFVPENQDCEVRGVQNDSRCVVTGEVFFAYPGELSDGRDYLQQAVDKGAVALVCESFSSKAPAFSLPLFEVTDLKQKIGEIVAIFYGHASAAMQVVGITGTNGKTSCTQYLAQALTTLNRACAVIGTLGYGSDLSKLQKTRNTTPGAIELQQQFADLNSRGLQYVALEVSSHSLAQYRIDGVAVDIAVFTQLSREHLDYHGNMQNYAKAKSRLFSLPGLRYAVVNIDDDWGNQLAQNCAARLPTYAYSLQPENTTDLALVCARKIEKTQHGFLLEVSTPWGEGQINLPLLGRFNISNCLAVLTVLGILEMPLPKALSALSQLQNVRGRMQLLGGGVNQPVVIVDYAHTPDALAQVLGALKEHYAKKIWCVFGCGGERDKGKRAEMGEVAERLADFIVLTDDNPRGESQQKIVADICLGIKHPDCVITIHDRAQAIAHAIANASASADQLVLVAGKGHETEQVIGDKISAFDDVVQVGLELAKH